MANRGWLWLDWISLSSIHSSLFFFFSFKSCLCHLFYQFMGIILYRHSFLLAFLLSPVLPLPSSLCLSFQVLFLMHAALKDLQGPRNKRQWLCGWNIADTLLSLSFVRPSRCETGAAAATTNSYLKLVVVVSCHYHVVDLEDLGGREYIVSHVWPISKIISCHAGVGGRGFKERQLTIRHSWVARSSCCRFPIRGSMTKLSRISVTDVCQ